MGNAKLWWFPDPGGTVEEIDLGEGLQDLQATPDIKETSSESMTGVSFTNRTMSRNVARVLNDRFVSFSRQRELLALENHLLRGGRVAVAEDSAKAVAGYLVTNPVRGATTVTLAGQPWPFGGVTTLTSGDEVYLQSASPTHIQEMLTVSSASGTTYTLAESVRFNYQSEPWVLFRARGFWPYLFIPPKQRGKKLLTDDHRISFTFDATLTEYLPGLQSFADAPGSVVQTNGGSGATY